MIKNSIGHGVPRGLVGQVQGGVSTANLLQALETKGLTSANLAAALANLPSVTQPAQPPTSTAPASTGDKK
jgi:hypothetical protein